MQALQPDWRNDRQTPLPDSRVSFTLTCIMFHRTCRRVNSQFDPQRNLLDIMIDIIFKIIIEIDLKLDMILRYLIYTTSK